MSDKKTVWIIHQYASTPDTGMGGRHYYLAQELAKQGYNVYLIASSANHLLHKAPCINSRYKFQSISGFTFVWVKMPKYSEAHSKQRALNWFLFPWRIQKLAKLISDKPDTILCSSPSPIAFLGAQKLAKHFHAKLVFEVRDIWPLTLTELGGYAENHPFIRFMQWVEDKAYRESDEVVSNLKYSVEHMIQHGLEKRKFTWIANGFSLDEVNQKISLDSRIKLQLPKNKFVIGYTGSIGIANSIDTLIQAADIIRNNLNIAFVIVGSGKEKRHLQSIVKERHLDNIIFIDPIPKVQIQSMISNFDACYIGLTKDPLFKFGVSPNKLFDYLYSGKPILYAIDSGAYKPVQEANAGLHVPAENPKELANTILKLYNLSETERHQMGKNGRNVALAEYEYSKLATKLAAVLFK